MSSLDAVEHDVPSHDCSLEEDNVSKEGEKMVRDEPHPSPTSSTTKFWNSLGTIASSVQSTVSDNSNVRLFIRLGNVLCQ